MGKAIAGKLAIFCERWNESSCGIREAGMRDCKQINQGRRIGSDRTGWIANLEE